jgi:hypothetical protein
MKPRGTVLSALILCVLLFASVQMTAQTTLISKKSSWSYLDDGSNQGTAWVDSGFNDSSWPATTGPFGYGSIAGATISATMNTGNETT